MKDKINVIDNKFGICLKLCTIKWIWSQILYVDSKWFVFFIANVDMSISLRDVLLNIEDTTFATLAAMSSTIRIEDETSPDDECLSPTESESAEFPHSKTGILNSGEKNIHENCKQYKYKQIIIFSYTIDYFLF